MSKPASFFAELKRRNVIRMAGLYLVGAQTQRAKFPLTEPAHV